MTPRAKSGASDLAVTLVGVVSVMPIPSSSTGDQVAIVRVHGRENATLPSLFRQSIADQYGELSQVNRLKILQ
ncbi:hypothetical protein OHA25_14475 [Nonomuraea sp. NBC_00507]|uniref:hypothetical protein n=1 Tax=Nonomuraea sp. NBC_00507 TaxID=2976002 RepID=UPI002E17D01D